MFNIFKKYSTEISNIYNQIELLNNSLNSLSSEVNNKIDNNSTLIQNIEGQILELNGIINNQNKH